MLDLCEDHFSQTQDSSEGDSGEESDGVPGLVGFHKSPTGRSKCVFCLGGGATAAAAKIPLGAFRFEVMLRAHAPYSRYIHQRCVPQLLEHPWAAPPDPPHRQRADHRQREVQEEAEGLRRGKATGACDTLPQPPAVLLAW